MTWRHYLLLFLGGLLILSIVAYFQPAPGYMDADYYYAGGIQIASGQGFTEPYLWNYLDDPIGLPHPSHIYWMPLASILAAIGMAIAGQLTWNMARIGFIVIAAMLPSLTAALAYSITSRRDLALTSGLLAIFSGFYLPFLSVSDTFGVYMLFGGLFFLVIIHRFDHKKPTSPISSFLLGLLAGLLHLSRAEGILWLFIALLVIMSGVVLNRKLLKETIKSSLFHIFFCLAGYLLILTPWFIRNWGIFNAPLAPSGIRTLWLTTYDQIFIYPADQLNFMSWWESGILAILRVRSWALLLNLANALSVQGEVFLLPLILVSVWYLRKEIIIRVAISAWLFILIVLTIVFPFSGARGGFFHSGASLQPLLWALAPLGLERTILWGVRKRGWKKSQAWSIFRFALVGAAVLLTIFVIQVRVIGDYKGERAWGTEDKAYVPTANLLRSQGISPEAVVMVSNPPGYYLSSGNPAIAVPDGDVETVLEVASRYEAKYLILEESSTPRGLNIIFKNPIGHNGLRYIGEVVEARIFAIQP